MEPQPRSPPWTPPDPTTIVIPGIDTTASINGQIDQIDQLITIRLQNIDANFSKIQHLIATKLLPAFRRYAEGTEPVREAAKFWKSFYEAAAQIRIPLVSDISLNQSTETEVTNASQGEQDSEQQSEEGDTTARSYDIANTTPTPGDSFMHGAPISSTPLVRDTGATGEEEAWSASIESPFERLHREVQNLAIEGELSSNPSFSPLPENHTDTFPLPTRPNPDGPKVSAVHTRSSSPPQSRSKGKSPLRENILRQNHKKVALSHNVPSHKTPHRRTPQHPFSKTHRWNGLVDLRQPSPSKRYTAGSSKPIEYDSDSSDDLIPPGMSPPVTMQFAMPARLRTSPAKLTLTPAKKAAEKLKGRYIDNAVGKGLGSSSRLASNTLEPSISSVAPSLPSITKYAYPSSSHITNSLSFNSRVPVPNVSSGSQQVGGIMTPAHQIYKSRSGPRPQASTAAGMGDELLINLSDDETVKVPSQNPVFMMPKSRLLIDDEASLSPGSDSDQSEHDEQNPSNGFLYATQNNAQTDDSFSDDGEDSITDVPRPNDQLHPVIDMFAQFEGQNVDMDDSFDQDSFSPNEEETVFGGRQAGQSGDGQLNIRNVPLIDDTHTGVASLNPFAQVEQSPTPYGGQAGPLIRK